MLGSYPKGSIKGLLNYNKDHGTRSLKKYASTKHFKVYRRWELFLLQTMAEIVNEKQLTNLKKLFLLLRL
jgi:hypothetical protein